MNKTQSRGNNMNRQESLESRILRWADHVAKMEEGSAFKILTATPAGKKPLGRPRRIWEGNIRVNLKKK